VLVTPPDSSMSFSIGGRSMSALTAAAEAILEY
jgi:hypothetical protein